MGNDYVRYKRLTWRLHTSGTNVAAPKQQGSIVPSNFRFDNKGIGDLLREGRLEVPPNQRSYAWEESHVRNFLEDLNEAIASGQEDYFLGTVVVVQSGQDTPSIADGQQRIATTSILLARIRDALFKAGRQQSARSIDSDFLRSIDRNTEQPITRLSLNVEDNEFFAKAILSGPLDPEFGVTEHPSAVRSSNKRLNSASEQIGAFLEDLISRFPEGGRADHLLSWVDFIQRKAGVVVVTVADDIGAYRIFETLNDRGLKASQADILKNYLYSRANTQLSQAISAWNAVAGAVEVIGGDENERLVTYIRHLWITSHGPTRERELAASIRSKITSANRSLTFLHEASARVQDYVALSNPQHQKWSGYKPSVKQNIEVLSSQLQVEQIRPLLFAVATKFTPEEAEKAFRLFVSWSVRFLIVGGRGGLLDAQYSQRAQDVGIGKVTKARELRDAMTRYVPNDTEFRQVFSTARVSRTHLARYYLRAIERFRADDPQPEYVPNDDSSDVNLEHILPLNPSEGWNVDPESARAAQKLIGNMVLLRADPNRDLGNATFAEKKMVLGSSAYLTTKEVTDNENWTVAEIRERQSRLANDAVKTWPLTFD
jgi:hypothetical protein